MFSAVNSVLRKFARDTSLHGFPRIITSSSTAGRLFWILVFLGSISAFCYYAFNILSLYLRFDKKVDMKISTKGIEFPQITVCNLNHISLPLLLEILNHYEKFPWDKPEAFNDIMMKYKKNTDPFVKEYFHYVQAIRLIQTTAFRLKRYDITALDYTKSRKGLAALLGINQTMRVSNPSSITIIACVYNGKKCNYEISEIFDAFFFKCHRITMKDEDNDNLIMYQSGLDKGVSLWIYIGRQPDETNIPGLNKLEEKQLRYRYGIDDATEPLGQAVGARIVVHPRGSMPFPLKTGISVPPHSHTSVGFTVTRTFRIGKPHGTCHSKQDRYYSNFTYSLPLCQNICTQRVTMEQCGCMDMNYPMLNSTDGPICMDVFRHYKSFCGNTQVNECKSLYKAYEALANENKCLENVSESLQDPDFYIKTCGCYPPCNDTDIAYTTSTIEWPRFNIFSNLQSFMGIAFKAVNVFDNKLKQHYSADLLKQLYFINESIEPWNDRALGENILPYTTVVNVYLSNNNIMEVREQPGYGEDQMVADLGGMLGLFIGLSAITLVEIIILLVNICIKCCSMDAGKRNNFVQ